MGLLTAFAFQQRSLAVTARNDADKALLNVQKANNKIATKWDNSETESTIDKDEQCLVCADEPGATERKNRQQECGPRACADSVG